jgi:peptidoglycan/xylan/chitin deacetylase (PgdA/CDA1 family)
MIYRAPFFLPWLYPNLVWRIPTEKKELYLTFDDGPVPGPTDFVLEVLAKHSIKATFFCIGDNVHKHPDVFKRVLDQGHTIGNHTFNHLKGWSTSLEKYLENVKQCEAEFRTSNLEFRTSNLFRPPYGKITSSQISALNDYRIVMWDVLTNDYDRAKSPEAVLKNSIRVTRPGSVIVFHDSIKAERNMSYALPRYIDHFLNLGYSFNKLS